MRKYFIVLISAWSTGINILSAQDTTPQKNVVNQGLAWLCYFQTYHFSDKWFITNELQYRTFLDPMITHQWLMRSHIHRVLNSQSDVSIGFSYFSHYPNDPDADLRIAVPELRPHVEYNVKQLLGKLTLTHRYRIEARWIHKFCEDELCAGYNFSGRFRYRLQLDKKVWKKDDDTYLAAKVSDEILLNVSENIVYNVFDQNRFYVALAFRTSKNVMMELGYLHIFQQRPSGIDFYDRDVLRINFFHTLNGKKRS